MSLHGFIPAILSLFVSAATADITEVSPVTCRRAALDLAAAWANDGFRLRDTCWTGTFGPGKPALVQVSLLCGNSYWFTAAGAAGAGDISIRVFTEAGKPVPVVTYSDRARAAVRFEPPASGTYLVKLDQTQSAASPFCLVYSYK